MNIPVFANANNVIAMM